MSFCDYRVQFALVWLNAAAHLNSSSALTSLAATLTLKRLLSPLDPLEQREGVTILTHANCPINHSTNRSPCLTCLPNMFLLCSFWKEIIRHKEISIHSLLVELRLSIFLMSLLVNILSSLLFYWLQWLKGELQEKTPSIYTLFQ